MANRSTTPKRTLAPEDEFYGWDASAGEEAFFPAGTAASKDAGPAVTQVPTGLDVLGGGLELPNRSSIKSVGPLFPAVTTGAFSHIALVPLSGADKKLTFQLDNPHQDSIRTSRINGYVSVVGGVATGRVQGKLEVSSVSPQQAVLETFDAGGQTWVGLRFTAGTIWTSGVAHPVLTGLYQDANGEAFDAAAYRSYDAADVTNAADIGGAENAYWFGFPGAAGGDNGPVVNVGQGMGSRTELSQGSDTQSGDGSTTTFQIPHGLGNAPTSVNVTPQSSAAADKFWVSGYDGTNITLEYAAAPASATDNLAWSFQAYREI